MRTIVTRGLVAASIAIFAFACSPSRQQRPASQPEPQQALNAPSTQSPTLPGNMPQEPIEHPVAQQPLPSAGPQTPASEPVPQKPWMPTEEQARGATETRLTDAEVLGVTEAANKGEIQMADLAMKKAQTPAVKKFAGEMKTMHQKALDSEKKLEQKAKVSASESDTASTLKTEADQTLKDLRDKKGKDFDRAYMDAQVKAHKDTLDIIDNRLMPAAQNDDVKSMLNNLRTHVADHLSKAEDARTKIDQPATAPKKGKAPTKGKTAPAPQQKR